MRTNTMRIPPIFLSLHSAFLRKIAWTKDEDASRCLTGGLSYTPRFAGNHSCMIFSTVKQVFATSSVIIGGIFDVII